MRKERYNSIKELKDEILPVIFDEMKEIKKEMRKERKEELEKNKKELVKFILCVLYSKGDCISVFDKH